MTDQPKGPPLRHHRSGRTGVWHAIRAGVGAALGVALDGVALGVGFDVAVGLLIGVLLARP